MGIVSAILSFIAAIPKLWAIYQEVRKAKMIKDQEKAEKAHQDAYKKLKDSVGKSEQKKQEAADDFLDSI
jgi:hypothetical protein